MTLLDHYDALLLDLDGTVYRGAEAVPGASEAVVAAHERGIAVRFVTNNASRAPEAVAESLRAIGVPADPGEVSTSAQAGAALAGEKVPPGSRVLVIGSEALEHEIVAAGLVPVREFGDGVAVVVQGLSKDTGWRDLAEACLAVKAGVLWIACNLDPTLPTERGEVIGNGSMVAAVRNATGENPIVAGKPARPLMDIATRSAGARRPLVIGDRLDTDIAGGVGAGLDSMLVLSGVTTPSDLLAAGDDERPRFVADSIAGVHGELADLEIGPREDWPVIVENGTGRVEWRGSGTPEPLDLLRALAAHDGPVRAGDDTTRATLKMLGVGEVG
ncbi:HAD superfamily hydrolase (TIGR01450 family) [Herbihabitans rhizosphaerae]|uniref:HAD superfamily hydrolase (TIGR01450 family) n=1 Tax=Herbihabitans rhizosphaerae TaxID=1872711 RepID=A0A4Q7KD71_9PSEU|nr:HAD-IIA family hydrolase [Herbihabitans rhizosphaerae]RZS29519.1 HAD superfamily hydrolase (TIGR01450 family) [Herbihabitans rhizosphaerae]